MPVAQEVSKALKDYKGTIWVGGEDDKAQGIVDFISEYIYRKTKFQLHRNRPYQHTVHPSATENYKALTTDRFRNNHLSTVKGRVGVLK